MEASVDGHATDLVARCAYGPAFVDLIFALDYFAAGLGDVSGEGEEEILGDALLDGDAGGGILIVAADQGIDLQTGNAGEPLHAAGELAGGLRGIMESVLWLEAADSCVVLPRAIRLMMSAVGRGGSET